MSRRELAAQAVAMRAHGATARQIATVLGVSRSYASLLYTDPDGRKERERKASYSRPCPNCGKPMTGCNGHGKDAPRLCSPCARAAQVAGRIWTRERIIAAIQDWAEQHGRPPTANDWLHADPDGRWPNRGSVYSDSSYGGPPAPFAYWADAVEAAGFPRPRRGVRPGDRHWTPALVIALLRERAVAGTAPASREDETLGAYARRFFGSWVAACAAAQVEPRSSRGRKLAA